MSLILVLSILLRVVALVWSLVLLRRVRDWRMGFFTVMLGFMVLRQILTLAASSDSWTISLTSQSTEFSGLIVSGLAFATVFYLERFVTERRLAESEQEAAQEREAALGRILEDSHNEIYIFDAATFLFLNVNRGARENLGYSMDELRKLTPIDLKPAHHSDTFTALVKPLLAGDRHEVRFETYHRRKDGSEYDVEVNLQLSKYRGVPAFVAIILDTTERKRAEEALHIRDRAFESTSTGIVIAAADQADHPIVYCNSAFESITGYSLDEVIGRNCRFLQRNDRDQSEIGEIRAALEEGRECQVVLRNYRKDGTLFWNELAISPVADGRGKISHFVGVQTDITERKRAEQALLDREARLQAVLNTAVEAIITIDDKGICEEMNPAAEKMFGYEACEVIGNNISMLMPPPFREEHDRYIANYLNTGIRKIIGIGRETVGRRKDGTEFPMHLSVSDVQLGQRRLFTGIIQDVTERKRIGQRLVQSERLAAIGEAMSRLAHESRNSLQRIQIAVETARLDASEGSELDLQLSSIERTSDGLNALLDEMRNYAAPIKLEKEMTTLPRVWREAWQAIASLRSGRQVRLQEETDDLQLTCDIDRFRMGQVFRNLFENSLAACGDPVEIFVSVTESHGENGPVFEVHFRDNGPGLTDEQKRRIFEPFFTTKSKGTGLGMAIAERIVQAHGGRISAAAAASGGAEIVIELPR